LLAVALPRTRSDNSGSTTAPWLVFANGSLGTWTLIRQSLRELLLLATVIRASATLDVLEDPVTIRAAGGYARIPVVRTTVIRAFC